MASVNLKLDNMRKEDSFSIYPFKEGDTKVTIQSKNRIGQFNVKTGEGVLSKAQSGGAYFHHLPFAPKFTLSALDLQTIKMLIFADGKTTDIADKGLVFADNSGSKNIFAL